MEFEQIVSQNIALAKACVLDDFAEFHVVDNFEAQRFVSSDCLIYLPTNQVECADTDVVFGFRVGHFPGPMPEDEHQLKKCQHHLFPGALHDGPRKKNQMVGALGLGVSDRAAQAVGAEHYIGVGK